MSGGTLRGSLRRLFSISGSAESGLVKSDPAPASPSHRVLVVGLGNYPAPRSRHSVGQYLLQCIAERNSVELTYKRGCKAHLASFQHHDAQIFLLKPKHFMNLSGKSVLKATTSLKICPSNVLLLHDELDLPLGKFKVKHGGSANGHNGVIDTQERLKFTEMKRLRVGIGRPENKTDVLDYVLEDFSRNERNLLNAMRESLIDTIYQTIAIMGSPQDETSKKPNQTKKKNKKSSPPAEIPQNGTADTNTVVSKTSSRVLLDPVAPLSPPSDPPSELQPHPDR